MGLRDIVFVLWAKFGTQALVLQALLDLAAGNYAEIQQGGRRLISSSINGQQYSFTSTNAFSVAAVARSAWVTIKTMTDAELVAWLETQSESFTTADFSALQA